MPVFHRAESLAQLVFGIGVMKTRGDALWPTVGGNDTDKNAVSVDQVKKLTTRCRLQGINLSPEPRAASPIDYFEFEASAVTVWLYSSEQYWMTE